MNIIVNKITTAIAALNTGRFFIGFEISPEYCDIAEKRIAEEQALTNMIHDWRKMKGND